MGESRYECGSKNPQRGIGDLRCARRQPILVTRTATYWHDTKPSLGEVG